MQISRPFFIRCSPYLLQTTLQVCLCVCFNQCVSGWGAEPFTAIDRQEKLLPLPPISSAGNSSYILKFENSIRLPPQMYLQGGVLTQTGVPRFSLIQSEKDPRGLFQVVSQEKEGAKPIAAFLWDAGGLRFQWVPDSANIKDLGALKLSLLKIKDGGESRVCRFIAPGKLLPMKFNLGGQGSSPMKIRLPIDPDLPFDHRWKLSVTLSGARGEAVIPTEKKPATYALLRVGEDGDDSHQIELEFQVVSSGQRDTFLTVVSKVRPPSTKGTGGSGKWEARNKGGIESLKRNFEAKQTGDQAQIERIKKTIEAGKEDQEEIAAVKKRLVNKNKYQPRINLRMAAQGRGIGVTLPPFDPNKNYREYLSRISEQIDQQTELLKKRDEQLQEQVKTWTERIAWCRAMERQFDELQSQARMHVTLTFESGTQVLPLVQTTEMEESSPSGED